MYGTQAPSEKNKTVRQFENDVNMYGTQACPFFQSSICQFENDVNMYGTQAYELKRYGDLGLRMM